MEQFDNICEVQSDKASVTITSRYDGKIVKLYHKIDEIALVGKPLVDVDVADEAAEDSSSSSSSSSDDEAPKKVEKVKEEACGHTLSQKVLTTPAVRRIAMENKVDLTKVTPTGKYGRLLKGDLLEYLNIIPAGTVKPHPTLTPTAGSAKIVTPGQVRVEQLKGVRKAMLKAMTESLVRERKKVKKTKSLTPLSFQKIPHFAYSDEIDMSQLMVLRDQLKAESAARGIKLTYMPFVMKAASQALKQFPIVNSSLDLAAESVVYKPYHNISVAMDTPEGLVVPNVKNCDQKSIMDIARDLNELMERGKRNQLKPDDFTEGTFSISNIGVVGGTYTHPCIMAPQVAIGAIGRTKLVPRFDEAGNIRKAYIMNVSWCADHRVIDGVTMASFSNAWKKYLEQPTLFLLD